MYGLGDATEELSAGLKNETLGGLLNATFGNAVEMIVSIQSLMLVRGRIRSGFIDVSLSESDNRRQGLLTWIYPVQLATGNELMLG